MTNDSNDTAHDQPGTGKSRWKVALALVVVLALIIAGIVVLVLMPPRKEKVAAATAAPVPVTTRVVAAADLPEVVAYAGRVEPETAVTVSAEQLGRVTGISLQKGDAAAQGQVLMTIDNSSYTLRVERAQATFRQADSDLRRFDRLRKTGSVADSDYENMGIRRDLEEIALKEARLDLDKCTILSPVDGIVEDRFVEKGEFVAPGARVCSIVNIDRVKIVLELPERDVFAVKPGQDLPFVIDSLPSAKFDGKISFIAPAADRKSNTFRVEALVENKDRTLKPGVIVRVFLTRQTIKDAVAVPLRALIPEKGMHVAYVVENGAAVRRQVKLRAIVGDQAVVQEGLKPGDRMIVEGQRLVFDGSPVSEGAGEGVRKQEQQLCPQ